MKVRGLLVLVLMLVVVFAAGCAQNEEALKAAEVYAKAMEAMADANSYAFDMELTQIIQFSDALSAEAGLDRLEVQSSGTGRAVQDPVAMEMSMSVNMPGLTELPEMDGFELGDMTVEFYMVDTEMFTYDSFFDLWIVQDLTEYGMDMEELAGLGQLESDPLFLLTLLGEDGAGEASLQTEGGSYILTLADETGQVMQRIMDEFVREQFEENLADLQMDAEMDALFANMDFSDLTYKIWIDQQTFYTTKVEMSVSMTMTIDGETMEMEQSSVMNFKDFGTFSSITVPAEVRNNAVTLDEYMESIFMDFDFDDFDFDFEDFDWDDLDLELN